MLVRGFKTWSENIAVQVRTELDLPGIAPLDPRRLAAHLAVALCTPGQIPGLSSAARQVLLGPEADAWSAVTISHRGRDLIIYNPTHSPARQTSDLMHELAHLLIGHEPTKLFLSQDGSMALRSYDKTQEAEASWLAGSLLLPRIALLHVTRSGTDIRQACRGYRVSQDLFRFRLHATGVNLQRRRAKGRQ